MNYNIMTSQLQHRNIVFFIMDILKSSHGSQVIILHQRLNQTSTIKVLLINRGQNNQINYLGLRFQIGLLEIDELNFRSQCLLFVFAVAREPADERPKRCGLVGSKAGYRVKRGCYFLPFGLEHLLPSCSRDAGYCTNVHA